MLQRTTTTARPLVRGALFTLIALAMPLAHGSEPVTSKDQTVVVHLSSYTDDLHAVNMSLKIATLLASAGADVTLFVDLEGVRLADERAPQDLQWGQTAPVGELYEDFIDAGGKVLVCPHCARAAGIEAGNLRPGATLATDARIRELMLVADKVIDY